MPWEHGRAAHTTAAMRRAILTRDEHTCQYCGDTAYEVDHIIPLTQGGTHDPSNLQALCRACHTAKTRTEAILGARRHRAGARHPGDTHPGLIS